MEDKTLREESSDQPRIIELDQIEDPDSRKEFEEMEKVLRRMERLNREIEEELRQAGLI